MRTRFGLVFAAFSALTSACVVDNPIAYDSCKTAADCTGLYADVCVDVAQTWAGGVTIYDSICSTGCTSDGGCSLSANGLLGFCSTYSVLGAAAGTCFERCYTHADCNPGWACAGSKDVYNLPAKELICVPATTAPLLVDLYSTCSRVSECVAGANRCEVLDPKWETTTASFQLSICTQTCTSDASCPTSSNGEPGFCTPAGAMSDYAVCVERCDYQTDCRPGFYCAYTGVITDLPESTTDGICVPWQD